MTLDEMVSELICVHSATFSDRVAFKPLPVDKQGR